MTAEKIKIGIIGAGNIGNVHIRQFRKLPEMCEIAAVSDLNLALAESRAAEHGIPRAAKSPEELIDSDVDAVVIAVPNRFHAPLAIRAMESGKHVLLEKPMAMSSEEAREIVRVRQKTNKTLMMAHQMRFEAVPTEIKRQVERGELGRIYSAKAGWIRRKGIPGWGTWFTRKEMSGGGPLIDIGVHMLDLALYLMGGPKPLTVFGSAYAELGPRKAGIGAWSVPDWNGYYDVEDYAAAFIRMDDGSTLTLEVSWAVHKETDNAPFVELMGTEGGAKMCGNAGKLLTEKFDRPLDTPLSSPESDEDARVRMSRHFLECVMSGAEPIASAMSGLTCNLVLDAIYRSSETGHEVKIDWNI